MKLREEDKKSLIREALIAREYAYVPYSHFAVGAALLSADGTIYRGCNIENGAFTPTNCAERTAFFKAISEGVKDFTAICVVGAKEGEIPSGPCPPCGVCRQVMVEFCDQSFEVYLGYVDTDGLENVPAAEIPQERLQSDDYTLNEVIPLSFSLN